MFTSRNHAAADVGELLESIYQAIRFRYTGNSCAIDGDLCCCLLLRRHVGRKDLSLADTEIVLNIAREINIHKVSAYISAYIRHGISADFVIFSEICVVTREINHTRRVGRLSRINIPTHQDGFWLF